MATQTTAKPAGAKPAKAKAKVRTFAELSASSSLHDRIFALARAAKALGEKQKPQFSGTTYSGKEFTNFYGVTKKGGAFFRLAEDSEHFKKVKAAAIAAKGDLSKGSWTGSVQKFLDTIFAISGGTGGRSYNYAQLADIKL